MNIRPTQVLPGLWSAVDSDEYEPGDAVGYGRTEAEAVADLLEQIGAGPAEVFGECDPVNLERAK